MKTAIVIGHHENSKGALSKYFRLREFDFYNQAVGHICSNVTIFQHNKNISGYTTRIKDTARRINKGNFDLVIELHFNSFSDSSANGCETLYYFKSQKGRVYAQIFSKTVYNKTGIKLRHNGLKALANRKDRGFASVFYPNPPTILIEPFFGSNEEDCRRIVSPMNMAGIIDDFLSNFKL